MPLPILTCATAWDVQKNVALASKTTSLGDGYQQFGLMSLNAERVDWSVKSPALTKVVADSILSQLATFQGITAFLWSPDNGVNIPREAFFCDKWTLTPLGIDAYEIAATFTRDLLAPTSAYINTIDPTVILPMLEGGVNFLNTYISDSVPFATNSSGVVSNAFHVTVNRGNYIPSGSGTSEVQAKLILAMTQVNKSAVSASIKNLALYYAAYYGEALLSYFYAETIPSVPEAQNWLPHWLVTARSSQPLQGQLASNPLNDGYFNLQLNFVNGIAYIPPGTPNYGDKLSQIYKIYPTTSKLLYQNVYSPIDVGAAYTFSYFVDSASNQVYPSTSSYSGYVQVPTSLEVSGKIVLTSNFTGVAVVVYSTVDTSTTVAANTFIETYPIRRLTASPIEKNHSFVTSGILDDAFGELYNVTGNNKWLTARAANKYSTILAAQVISDTYLFKTDTTTFYAFSYPGTQFQLTNNTTPGTIQRLANGWIQCDIYVIDNSSHLVGSISQPQSLTGTLSVGKFLVGSISQPQVLTGILSASNVNTLIGSINQPQVLTGTLSLGNPLIGSISQPQVLTGNLSIGNALIGSISQPQVLTGTLSSSNANALVGSISQPQVLTGTLSVGKALIGSIVQPQVLTGNLTSTATSSVTPTVAYLLLFN